MKTLLVVFALCALLIGGCVSGNFEEDSICSYKEYPTIPAGFVGRTNEPISSSDSHDFSSALAKVKDFGDVEFALTSATLKSKENASLAFIEKLTLSRVRDDGSEEVIGSASQQQGSVIALSLKATDETLKAFESGPVTLKLTGEGSAPTQAITPMISICARAKANVDATLADAVK